MAENHRDRFIQKFQASLRDEVFVKLTLSSPTNVTPGLRNVYARTVMLRDGKRVQVLWRHTNKDVTQNYTFEDAPKAIRDLLGHEFEHAHLFTVTGDFRLRSDSAGRGSLKASQPVFATLPEQDHDRRKERPFDADLPWLRALGVMNDAGQPKPGMADKLRQIQRFGEIIGHLIDQTPSLRELEITRVVDMGAGKGYLTFALASILASRGIKASVLGLEQRPELVEASNAAAKTCGMDTLRFECGQIADWQGNADILVALHACDTATDDALFKGVSGGAALVVCAPCCHKEGRSAMNAGEPSSVLRPVLRHGILFERQAELFTDAIRAMLLEMKGYKADVFEFISNEHTGKNLMISGIRRASGDSGATSEDLFALCAHAGIGSQHLATLFGIPLADPA